MCTKYLLQVPSLHYHMNHNILLGMRMHHTVAITVWWQWRHTLSGSVGMGLSYAAMGTYFHTHAKLRYALSQ